MRILHHEKHFHYTDQEYLQVARKLGKLATYCKRLKDEDSAIRIDVEARKTQKTRDQLKIAITVELPDKVLRAESRKGDIVEGVDRCVDKLEPQVKKYKELHTSRGRSRKVAKSKHAAA